MFFSERNCIPRATYRLKIILQITDIYWRYNFDYIASPFQMYSWKYLMKPDIKQSHVMVLSWCSSRDLLNHSICHIEVKCRGKFEFMVNYIRSEVSFRAILKKNRKLLRIRNEQWLLLRYNFKFEIYQTIRNRRGHIPDEVSHFLSSMWLLVS